MSEEEFDWQSVDTFPKEVNPRLHIPMTLPKPKWVDLTSPGKTTQGKWEEPGIHAAIISFPSPNKEDGGKTLFMAEIQYDKLEWNNWRINPQTKKFKKRLLKATYGTVKRFETYDDAKEWCETYLLEKRAVALRAYMFHVNRYPHLANKNIILE